MAAKSTTRSMYMVFHIKLCVSIVLDVPRLMMCAFETRGSRVGRHPRAHLLVLKAEFFSSFAHQSGQVAMAGFGENPFGVAGMHADVLKVDPTSEEETIKIVAEIKSRGNKAFSARRMEEAQILYSRAIELCNTSYALFGNRAAVYNTMGQFDNALTDAEAAIKCDPEWAKGYFRKGQALMGLKKPHAATEAFETSLRVDQKANKTVEKELAKAKALGLKISKEEEEANTGKDATKSEWGNATPAPPISIQRKAEKLSGKDLVKDQEVSDFDDLAKSGAVRGYKKTKDGKTTSFFHRDIDDEAKKLIGSIAPKKIETREEDKTIANGAGSVWNQGGTYEEKNVDKVAKQRLEELFMSLNNVKFNEFNINVEKVKKLEGEAQVLVLRGKKRFMYEFDVELNFKAKSADGYVFSGQEFEGSLVYPDLSADACGDYECRVKIASPNVPEPLATDLKSVDGSLQTAVRSLMVQFEKEFF